MRLPWLSKRLWFQGERVVPCYAAGPYRLDGDRGWAAIVGADEVSETKDSLSLAILGWVLGCTFVYSTLFGTGALLYGQMQQGGLCVAVAVGTGIGLTRVVPKIWNEQP